MRATLLGLISILALASLPGFVSAEPAEGALLLAQAKSSPRRGVDNMDPTKRILTEIGQVYKARIAFAEGESQIWTTFWKKVRDERGQFAMRMEKQRAGFIDSLRSLDSEFHYSSLQDFEKLQGNMRHSFEEDQSASIQEFMALRESNLKAFGIAQEAERARLAGLSADAWETAKKNLHIEPISEDELKARGKDDDKNKKDSKSKNKKRKMKVHKVF